MRHEDDLRRLAPLAFDALSEAARHATITVLPTEDWQGNPRESPDWECRIQAAKALIDAQIALGVQQPHEQTEEQPASVEVPRA